MNKLARVGITSVAVGGALMMAAPAMAFAAENTTVTTIAPSSFGTSTAFTGQAAGGSFSQSQYSGTGNASNMAEGATFSAGNTQAETMGGTFGATDGYQSGSSFNNSGLGSGGSYTNAGNISQSNYATDLNQQSLSGALNQNMSFMGGDESMGGQNASQSQSAWGGTVSGHFWTKLLNQTGVTTTTTTPAE